MNSCRLFAAAQRWFGRSSIRHSVPILLIDYPRKPGEAPDGSVDSMLSYFDVSGDWPLGERWKVLYRSKNTPRHLDPRPTGLGLTTPAGVVQLRSDMGIAEPEHHDASVIAVMSYRGSSGAGGRFEPFHSIKPSRSRPLKRRVNPVPARSDSQAGPRRAVQWRAVE